MKKRIVVIALLTLSLIVAKCVFDLREVKNEPKRIEPTIQKIAKLSLEPIGPKVDPRVEELEDILGTRNNDAIGLASYFVYFGDVYGVDYKLVVAVGALESGWFKYCVGGNCFGHNSSNGYVFYPTAKEGIMKATQLFTHSMYRGKTIDEIGEIYAADPEWASKVREIYKTL